MRDDLPEAVQRDLIRQRRELVREVGRTYTELVKAHADPTLFLAAVERMCRHHLADHDLDEAA